MSALVADGDKGLETGDLTGGRHLLHGHDLHHLVLQLRPEEEVDNLVLCRLFHRGGTQGRRGGGRVGLCFFFGDGKQFRLRRVSVRLKSW